MSQTFTDDVYAGSHVAKTDLQNMENNFAALKSGFSGTSAPSNVVGGMTWHDSTARKARNYANTAWLISLLGDANQKMYVYRNNTCEGWLVDSSVTDRVLAIKGGTGSYNVTGGNAAGSWAITGVTVASHTHTVASHVHQIYDYDNVSSFRGFNATGTPTLVTVSDPTERSLSISGVGSTASVAAIGNDLYTDIEPASTTGATQPAATGNALWRPAAAVGTLQYPDVS